MAEINNSNFVKYPIGNKPIEINNKEKEAQPQQTSKETQERSYVPDTGVLGRSQVKCSKCGADITQSVDEAVALAKGNPGLLLGSDRIFDSIYNGLLLEGMEESEAYMKALACEEEFMQMGIACNK